MSLFVQTLGIMVKGMVVILGVMAIVMLLINLLNRYTNKKPE